MYPSEMPNRSNRPRVTVAAIVERGGRFLFVEESDLAGRLVINQPAGHVEGGETVLEAVVREILEETGWHIRPEWLVGCYLWHPSDDTINYLRIAIAGRPERHDPALPLDEGIQRILWLTPEELAARQALHRSPMVMRCLEDYLAGERHSLSILKSFRA